MSDTQTVTVADAYARRLWKTGALWHPNLGPYMPIVSIITAPEASYDLTTEGGNVIRRFGRTHLAYTPHAPAPTPDPQAEIAALRAERDAALEAMHTLQDARNDFAGRLNRISALCESLPGHSGEIDSTNAGYIIETINTIYAESTPAEARRR